jgi:SPP1 gp7 family putative phage head morphogenesis protein
MAKKGKKRLPPNQITLDYSAKINKLVKRAAKLVGEDYSNELLKLKEKLDGPKSVGDLGDILERINRKLKADYYGERLLPDMEPSQREFSRIVEAQIVKPVAKQVSKFHAKKFISEFRQVTGVDPITNVPGVKDALEMFARDNIELIKKVPSTYFDDVESIVMRGFRSGDSTRSITARIKEATKTSESRAKLIARDQVGKLNAQLEEIRAANNGIKRYVWHTNKDGRERPDHLALDGSIQEWNSPPVTVSTGKRAGETNHPGEDIQCRCWAENLYTDLVENDSKAS